MEQLRKVRSGEPVTAELWNALVEAVNHANQISVGGTLSIIDTASGKIIRDNARHPTWFRMNEALAAGDHAAAVRLLWNGSDFLDDPSGATVQVYADDAAQDHVDGDRVQAFFDGNSGRWWLFRGGGGGGGSNCFVLFTLKATLNKTHASGLGEVQEVVVGSGPGVGDTINLVNPLHVATTRRVFEGNVDDLGFGLVRGDGDVQIVWIICPASRVVEAPQPPPEQSPQGGGSPPPQIINPGGPI